jgi:hypothetical protein
MSVRSRTTGKHTPRPSRASRPAPQPTPPKPSAASKVGNSLKAFAGWVAKNQEDYKRKTGDTSSLGDELRNIPGRVCRNLGESGREEQQDLRNRCRQDDDDLIRFVSGHPKRQPNASPPTHLEFTIKQTPKRRPKPKVKIIYAQFDENAEVGYYGKK